MFKVLRGAHRGQPKRIDQRIFWIFLPEFVRERLCLTALATQRQPQGRTRERHLVPFERERLSSGSFGLRALAEDRSAQRGIGGILRGVFFGLTARREVNRAAREVLRPLPLA